MKQVNLPGKPVIFPMGWRGRVVYGGPYGQYKQPMFGIKMAEEIDMPCDVPINTRDFSVPKVPDMQNGIRKALHVMAAGKPIYVGCMGGVGRTGLFLACLAKTLGIEEPVNWVRMNYKPHAVETRQQERYVDQFDTSALQSTAKAAKLKARLYFWK